MAVSDEVWATARTIWEQDQQITFRKLLKKLKELFGDDAPRSTSTLANRMKKEQWEKSNNFCTPKKETEQEQKTEQDCTIYQKNNKETRELVVFEKIEQTEQKIEQEMSRLVMSSKQRAAIIIKHRKRLKQLGDFQEVILDTANTLENYDIDSNEDGDNIKKILIVTKEMSVTLTQLTASQKMIAEQEFAVCGITPDDFVQSEQDRRLGALAMLQGIEDEEREARHRLKDSLMERLSWIEEVEQDPDLANIADIVSDDG